MNEISGDHDNQDNKHISKQYIHWFASLNSSIWSKAWNR